MGDLQRIYSPIVIHNAFSSGNAAIIGNSSDVHTEPAFIYTDASDISLIMTVAAYDNIPLDLHPEEHLSLRIVTETSWASAKVKLGVVYLPMVAPLFFRQKTIKSSVHNPDFEDQLRAISPIHFQWAQLIKEHLTQKKTIQKTYLVINCLSKSRNKAETLKMVTSGLGDICVSDSTFLSVFTLPSDKWSLHQEKLRDFFVGNPSRVKNRSPHSRVCFEASANPSPQKDDTNHQPLGSPAACKDPPPPLQNMPFDPMAFLKDWGEKICK